MKCHQVLLLPAVEGCCLPAKIACFRQLTVGLQVTLSMLPVEHAQEAQESFAASLIEVLGLAQDKFDILGGNQGAAQQNTI